MKKSLFLAAAMLVTGSAFAATDHYVLRMEIMSNT